MSGIQESIRSINIFFISLIIQCGGVSLRRQLEHISMKNQEGHGLFNVMMPSRRYEFDPRELTNILGVPNKARDLPEAEAILPGHTLNRPVFGMLKSSIKFPHRELEDGAGVYGNYDNLGLKYDSRNERLLHTGFRRFPSDYIMVIPSTSVNNIKPRFKLASTVLDMDRKDTKFNPILKIIKKLNNQENKSNVRVHFRNLNSDFFKNLQTSKEVDDSHKWDKYVDDEDVYKLYDKRSSLHNTNPTGGQRQRSKVLRAAENDFDVADTDQDVKSKKIQWLLNSKDDYNHIKINQDAPELNELIPPMKNENIRQWWFYNADDYKHFS